MRVSRDFINDFKKINKGFTLVELLAVIAVLSLVIGLVVFIAINVIDNAREKTYKTAINNIEAEANSYLTENSGRLFYIANDDNSYEYQCVTIQNLIDMGYFDTDVTESLIDEDRNVRLDDYIYIKRNIDTKAIISAELDVDGKYSDICGVAVNALGDIRFDISPSLDEWSREKTVVIKYLLSNLNDFNTISNYVYSYRYSNDSETGSMNDRIVEKTILIKNDDYVYADVKNGTEMLNSKSVEINKMDIDGPVITLGSYTSGYVKEKVVIPLKVTDNESGFDKSSFTTSDIVVTVGDENITDYSIGGCSNNGICNLTINNSTSNGEVIITIKENTIFDRVVDTVKNGNSETILKPNIKFDNVNPVITLSNDGNSSYEKVISSVITVTDDYSGGNKETYKYIYSTSNTAVPNSSFLSNNSYSKNDGNGNYYLIVEACDNAGNCTRKVSKAFKHDSTPPVIVFGTDGNSTYSKKASSKITVNKDNLSGVDTSTYKYVYSTSKDDTPNTKFVSGSSYSKSGVTGDYYLIAKACDKAGNCTTKTSNVFKLDNTGPVITLGTDGNSTYSKTASSKITVSDNHSGGDTSKYKYIYSTSKTATPGTTFTSGSSYSKTGVTGNYYLIVKACDKVGNCTTKTSEVFKLDHTNPVITLGTNGNSSYSKTASSKITVSDKHSGGDTKTYKYIYSTSTSDTPNITFTSGSNYTVEDVTGNYYLIVKACDGAGNCATKASNVFKLDNITPTCKLKVTTSGISFASKSDNISVTSYGIIKSTTPTYNSKTTLTLTTGTVYGYVKDVAGNMGKCSVDVANVSKTCPDGYKDYGNASQCRKYNTTYCDTCNGDCLSYSYQCTGYFNPRDEQCHGGSWENVCTSYEQVWCNCWEDYSYSAFTYTCSSGYTNLNNSYCYKIN